MKNTNPYTVMHMKISKKILFFVKFLLTLYYAYKYVIREKCAFNTNDKDSILGRTLYLLSVIFHLTEI